MDGAHPSSHGDGGGTRGSGIRFMHTQHDDTVCFTPSCCPSPEGGRYSRTGGRFCHLLVEHTHCSLGLLIIIFKKLKSGENDSGPAIFGLSPGLLLVLLSVGVYTNGGGACVWLIRPSTRHALACPVVGCGPCPKRSTRVTLPANPQFLVFVGVCVGAGSGWAYG